MITDNVLIIRATPINSKYPIVFSVINLVGQNNDRAKITKIEFHEKSGEVSINTTRGPRNVLTFRLCEEDEKERYENAADKYR